METDKIRATLDEARRACAEAESPLETSEAHTGIPAQKLATATRKLIEATESLLAEREAFTGRLRRSAAVRPAAAVAAAPVASSPREDATPSPAPDASH